MVFNAPFIIIKNSKSMYNSLLVVNHTTIYRAGNVKDNDFSLGRKTNEHRHHTTACRVIQMSAGEQRWVNTRHQRWLVTYIPRGNVAVRTSVVFNRVKEHETSNSDFKLLIIILTVCLWHYIFRTTEIKEEHNGYIKR